jgi:hypothetical protein
MSSGDDPVTRSRMRSRLLGPLVAALALFGVLCGASLSLGGWAFGLSADVLDLPAQQDTALRRDHQYVLQFQRADSCGPDDPPHEPGIAAARSALPLADNSLPGAGLARRASAIPGSRTDLVAQPRAPPHSRSA